MIILHGDNRYVAREGLEQTLRLIRAVPGGNVCSRLSSDIKVFVIKKKQKKAQGFVGMGAFIWEDNIAGRIFPYGTINRYIEIGGHLDE